MPQTQQSLARSHVQLDTGQRHLPQDGPRSKRSIVCLGCAALAATVVVNSTSNSTTDNTGPYHCTWGPPVLEPTPRDEDKWGIGWENLATLEAMEIATEELLDVSINRWLHQHALTNSMLDVSVQLYMLTWLGLVCVRRISDEHSFGHRLLHLPGIFQVSRGSPSYSLLSMSCCIF